MSKGRRYRWGGFIVIVSFALILAFLRPGLTGHRIMVIAAPMGIIAGIIMWVYGVRESYRGRDEKKDDGGSG